jgi:hypothetical protein
MPACPAGKRRQARDDTVRHAGWKPALPGFGQTVEELKKSQALRMTLSNKLARCGLRKNRRGILRCEDSAQNDGSFKLGNKIQWVRSFVANGAPQDDTCFMFCAGQWPCRQDAGATRRSRRREVLRFADSAQNDGSFKLGNKMQWLRSFVANGAPQDDTCFMFCAGQWPCRQDAGATNGLSTLNGQKSQKLSGWRVSGYQAERDSFRERREKKKRFFAPRTPLRMTCSF